MGKAKKGGSRVGAISNVVRITLTLFFIRLPQQSFSVEEIPEPEIRSTRRTINSYSITPLLTYFSLITALINAPLRGGGTSEAVPLIDFQRISFSAAISILSGWVKSISSLRSEP
jgi:hypothetical protein